jgi:exosortase
VLIKDLGVSTSAVWTGVGLIALGTLLRLGSAYYAKPIPDMVSIVPCLLGVFLLAGRWKLLEWSWPAILFLIFMFPLPDFVERGLLDPLQRIATQGSTFALQTLGVSAFSEGNRIVISVDGGDLQMGVVDACSGLRMLTIFFALATAITLVTDRPIWERLLIIASAFPIALAVNMIRIALTGVLMISVGGEIAHKIFHDLAGWVMIPMALGFLYVELQILTHLFVDETSAVPMPLMRGQPGVHKAQQV